MNREWLRGPRICVLIVFRIVLVILALLLAGALFRILWSFGCLSSTLLPGQFTVRPSILSWNPPWRNIGTVIRSNTKRPHIRFRPCYCPPSRLYYVRTLGPRNPSWLVSDFVLLLLSLNICRDTGYPTWSPSVCIIICWSLCLTNRGLEAILFLSIMWYLICLVLATRGRIGIFRRNQPEANVKRRIPLLFSSFFHGGTLHYITSVPPSVPVYWLKYIISLDWWVSSYLRSDAQI